MRRMERMLLYMRMLLILKGLVTEIAIPSLSLRTMLLLLLWATFLPMSLSLCLWDIIYYYSLFNGQWTMGDGQLDTALEWAMDDGRWTMGDGVDALQFQFQFRI